MRADISAHVLHDTEDGELKFLDELHGLGGIEDGDLLRCRDNDCAGDIGCKLCDRKSLIAGSRRQIDNEVIQLAPVDILEELPDCRILHRTSPDNRACLVGEQERHRNHAEIAHDHNGVNLLAVHRCQLLILDAQHLGNIRTVNIHIGDTCRITAVGKRHCKVCGDRTLSHAAFAA